jgi:hypothetical protein
MRPRFARAHTPILAQVGLSAPVLLGCTRSTSAAIPHAKSKKKTDFSPLKKIARLSFLAKIIGIPTTLLSGLADYPRRLLRLGKAILGMSVARGLLLPQDYKRKSSIQHPFFAKTCIALTCFADLLFLPELYQIIYDWLKYRTRPLTPEEIALGKKYYGNTIPWSLVRINSRAKVVSKRANIAFVSFHTINTWGDMPPSLFIHELAHVAQFSSLGSSYIVYALLAQASTVGYNYSLALPNAQTWSDFNLEQQADLVSDCYRIEYGFFPVWVKNGTDPSILRRFLPVK